MAINTDVKSIFWPLCCLSFLDLWILITLWYLQTLLLYFSED